jgi:hypothetical protein
MFKTYVGRYVYDFVGEVESSGGIDREDEKETLTSAVYLHTYTHG